MSQRIRYEEGQRGASPVPPDPHMSTAPTPPPPGAAGSSTAVAEEYMPEAVVAKVKTETGYFGITTTITVEQGGTRTGARPKFSDLPIGVQVALTKWVEVVR